MPSRVKRTKAAQAFERAAEIDVVETRAHSDWIFRVPFALPLALDQIGPKAFSSFARVLDGDGAFGANARVEGQHGALTLARGLVKYWSMLMSDLFPLLLFLSFLRSSPSPALLGMVASRAFSLVFHVFSETCPFLINLDCIGIACMAFASREACKDVGCDESYDAWLAAAFVGSVFVFAYDLFCRRPTSRQSVIVLLAAVGQFPCFWALWTGHPRAPLLCCASVAFGVGYFAVEPRSHVGWHWVAFIGQLCVLL